MSSKRGAGASLPPPISKLSPVWGEVSVSQSEARMRSQQPIRSEDSHCRVMVADVCNGHILLDVPFFCQPRLSSSPSFFTLLSNIVVWMLYYSFIRWHFTERNCPGIFKLNPSIISSSINSTCSWHFMEILFYYFSKIAFHFIRNSTRQAGTGKILT